MHLIDPLNSVIFHVRESIFNDAHKFKNVLHMIQCAMNSTNSASCKNGSQMNSLTIREGPEAPFTTHANEVSATLQAD